MTDTGEPMARAAYEEVADTYDAEVETNPYNAYLEFPGTSGLVPDVEGRRVLDAGCGTGIYTEWLLEGGAEVVGIDASAAMLEHARERVGDRADLHEGDLADPLPFDDDAFDGIVSALVLDYLEDWRPTFAEFARVLPPGGFLVFSVGHPVEEYVDNENVNYFETELRHKQWDVEVPYYRRPLSEMIDPLLETGFRIDGIAEPQPTEAFREALPEAYEKESEQPVFLCLRAVRE